MLKIEIQGDDNLLESALEDFVRQNGWLPGDVSALSHAEKVLKKYFFDTVSIYRQAKASEAVTKEMSVAESQVTLSIENSSSS